MSVFSSFLTLSFHSTFKMKHRSYYKDPLPLGT